MITTLTINNLRNQKSTKLSPSPHFNIITGPNGSGKTTILEAIHILSLGRSFRTRYAKRLINIEAKDLLVTALLENSDRIAVQKKVTGETEVRHNRQSIRNISTLTALLPVQTVHSESDLLVSGSPKIRRKFLDWGVFHVEHRFFHVWQHYQKALKQRNAALRNKATPKEIITWNKHLVHYGELLNQFRKNYMESLNKTIADIASDFEGLQFDLQYYQGWKKDESLAFILESSLARDQELQYTHAGPHRADIRLKSHNMPAHEVLSRGQQKVLVLMLALAQGLLLKQLKDKQCIYLIDDLTSELDAKNSTKVLKILENIGAQVFLTGVDDQAFRELITNKQSNVFHVEHI